MMMMKRRRSKIPTPATTPIINGMFDEWPPPPLSPDACVCDLGGDNRWCGGGGEENSRLCGGGGGWWLPDSFSGGGGGDFLSPLGGGGDDGGGGGGGGGECEEDELGGGGVGESLSESEAIWMSSFPSPTNES